MSAPRRDYRRDEFAVMGAWHASRGSKPPESEAEIRARTSCSPKVALRVWVLQRAACPMLITLWLDGCLSLREAERIALPFAFDEGAQLDEAKAAKPVIRMRLSRATE